MFVFIHGNNVQSIVLSLAVSAFISVLLQHGFLTAHVHMLLLILPPLILLAMTILFVYWQVTGQQATPYPGTRRQTRGGPSASDTSASTSTVETVAHIIRQMPIESYVPTSDFSKVSLATLKTMLQHRNVSLSHHSIVERTDVEQLLQDNLCSSYYDTCCICYDDFQIDDLLRVSKACRHVFHVECIDKWALISSTNNYNNNYNNNNNNHKNATIPKCPICKTPFG